MTKHIDEAIDSFIGQEGMEEYGEQAVIGHIDVRNMHHLTDNEKGKLPHVLARCMSDGFNRRAKRLTDEYSRPLTTQEYIDDHEEVNFKGFKMSVLVMMGMMPNGALSGYGAFQVGDVSVKPYDKQGITYVHQYDRDLEGLFVYALFWGKTSPENKTLLLLPVRQFLADALSGTPDFMKYTRIYKGKDLD